MLIQFNFFICRACDSFTDFHNFSTLFVVKNYKNKEWAWSSTRVGDAEIAMSQRESEDWRVGMGWDGCLTIFGCFLDEKIKMFMYIHVLLCAYACHIFTNELFIFLCLVPFFITTKSRLHTLPHIYFLWRKKIKFHIFTILHIHKIKWALSSSVCVPLSFFFGLIVSSWLIFCYHITHRKAKETKWE